MERVLIAIGRRRFFRRRAFTLIELLIVVAIIAILAAIAVPNFIEAQVRAKMSRVKSDMRSMAAGLEAYASDNSKYPDVDASALSPPIKYGPDYCRQTLCLLSTPVAYLASGKLRDIFLNRPLVLESDVYFGYANCKETMPFLGGMGISPTDCQTARFLEHRWLVQSVGPDGLPFAMMNTPEQNFMLAFIALTDRTDLSYYYDPTNGTISIGDVVRTAKGQI
ncbi:MAG: prepilin-type N-terminal cleavage/methylation domain-containing protein [bacterium]